MPAIPVTGATAIEHRTLRLFPETIASTHWYYPQNDRQAEWPGKKRIL